ARVPHAVGPRPAVDRPEHGDAESGGHRGGGPTYRCLPLHASIGRAMRFDISHRRRSRGDGLDSLARVGRPFRMPLRVLPAAFLSGCDGIQAIMNPHGPDAAEIATIGWIMFGGATVIFVIVLALMLYALIARPDRRRWLGGIKLVIAGG